MKDIMHRQLGTRKTPSPRWDLNPSHLCAITTSSLHLYSVLFVTLENYSCWSFLSFCFFQGNSFVDLNFVCSSVIRLTIFFLLLILQSRRCGEMQAEGSFSGDVGWNDGWFSNVIQSFCLWERPVPGAVAETICCTHRNPQSWRR